MGRAKHAPSQPSNPFHREPAAPAIDPEERAPVGRDGLLGSELYVDGPAVPPGAPAPAGPAVLRATEGSLDGDCVAVVGLHGGAGVTTVARLLQARESDKRAGIRWVEAPGVGQLPTAGRVLLVARDSGVGLERAQHAAREWAARQIDPAVDIMGLLLVASGPKIDGALGAQAKRVTRMWPRTWRVVWLPEWHVTASPAVDRLPGRVRRTADSVITWAAKRRPSEGGTH